MFRNISPSEQSSIMIDFIEVAQYQCKDSPFLGHCKPFPCKLNQYGWDTYTLQGCKEMEVHWNPEQGTLRVKGSLPYYLQGHNFSFSNADLVEGVGMIQGLLGVPLWDAQLEEFEFGCIFPVAVKPALYIRNHTALPEAHLYMNEKGRDKGAFRWWDDSARALKLYDAGRNIKMKQGMKAREVIEDSGYNPEGTPHKGSAIFLHCGGTRPTGGCVAVSESSMITIMRAVRSGCKIIIDYASNLANY